VQGVDLLRLRPTVLRGNGSEILALSGADAASKGADPPLRV
jgi:hydroxyethylthiazole kinase